jgi:hypothetical protein
MPLQEASKRADHVAGLRVPLAGGAAGRPAGNAEFDRAAQRNLADTALRLARNSGAEYADLRIGCDEEEVIHAREMRFERFNSILSAGFGIRVLLHGSWGFASSQTIKKRRLLVLSVSPSKMPRRTAGSRRYRSSLRTYRPTRTTGSCRCRLIRSPSQQMKRRQGS